MVKGRLRAKDLTKGQWLRNSRKILEVDDSARAGAEEPDDEDDEDKDAEKTKSGPGPISRTTILCGMQMSQRWMNKPNLKFASLDGLQRLYVHEGTEDLCP